MGCGDKKLGMEWKILGGNSITKYFGGFGWKKNFNIYA